MTRSASPPASTGLAPANYQVELEVFEGPLDLLLHLVKKHELDVVDIPVAFVTEKYLEYLELMRTLNLEIAGEYLVMAATLAHLKSCELLPPDPRQLQAADGDDEEGEGLDPRQELIRRLLEYQKYRQAAASLDERPVVGRNVWTRGASTEAMLPPEAQKAEAPLAEVPVIQLVAVLADVLSKARVKLTHDVHIERLTITDRINQLVDRLDAEGTFAFRSCFAFLERDEEAPEEYVKHQVVVTFLAVLEMARLKLIRVTQPDGDSDIYIARAVEDVKARARTASPSAGGEYRG